MNARKGFTLVEILIVVVILGILAAIVIPQFTEASTESKESRLASDLQMVRAQIELYKIQHNDNLPTWNNGVATGVTFETAMTTYTLQDGSAAPVQAPGDGVYGPYMQRTPINPFIPLAANADIVTVVDGAGLVPAGADSSGWWFNATTGDFRANDQLSTSSGTPHINL
jgi:general secretion pathway protein G